MEIYRDRAPVVRRRQWRLWQKMLLCCLVMMVGGALLLARFGVMMVVMGLSIWLLLWLASAAVMIRLDREGRLR